MPTTRFYHTDPTNSHNELMARSAWIGLVCLTLGGCNLLSDDTPAVQTNILEEVQLDLWNPLSPEHNMAFVLTTLADQCPGTRILHNSSIQGPELSVHIMGLEQPTGCAELAAQATEQIGIQLGQDVYDVRVSVGNVTNQGFLVASSSAYELRMITSDGIVLGHTELAKIPEFTIWGSITSDHNVHDAFAAFQDELELIAEKPGLLPGYYGHFEILSSAELSVLQTDASQYAYDFIYKLTGELSALRALIDDVRSEHNGQLSIHCTTWTGLTL